MIVFLGYVFNEHNLVEYMKDEWLKLYDVPWVDNLIASVLVWLPDAEALMVRDKSHKNTMCPTRAHPRGAHTPYSLRLV